ncbi:aminopeptidase [Lutimonas saemankumensis]|uniref:aminopeptidase n=1 Tax=Lutimonas saemankumensis TaxID=483016 RepID=UPI001CD50034|nr:aminopeptidase [Lutimonas saemankumensis]MCA0933932.1 aminopeptidase [Lutimonas saemankumensis]
MSLKAVLMQDYKILIDQDITYFNPSDSILDTIYLLNWANGYKDKTTPLTRRLIEDYDKSLYFANIKDRGYSAIRTLTCDNSNVLFYELKGASDILKVVLPKPLGPGESTKIQITYEVKVPKDKYTRYGRNPLGYKLRYWHLTPAVFDKKWHLFSNLNMDDHYMHPADIEIEFSIPLGYTLNSDLEQEVEIKEDHVLYRLSGKNRLDTELSIQPRNDYSVYPTSGPDIITNLKSKNLTENIKADVLQRQLDFIADHLGKYPHSKLMVSQTTYQKRPVYGFNQLPKKLNPFSDIFEWDIKIFKALTERYIENTILTNPREDNWLADGIQIYLMMEYVKQFYPEVKAIGNISKKWGIRRYNIAKLDFNGKYPFVYQFSTRKQLDQSLTTRADSLSNINLKLVNKYKSGLGLRYLDAYLEKDIIRSSLRLFYRENALKLSTTDQFNRILISKADKDLNWFFDDYLTTNNKINYTIDKIKKDEDSVHVTIRNRSNFSAPMLLYGLDKKSVKFEQWIEPLEDETTVTVPKKDIDRLNLNYEYLIPEDNLRDNWKKLDKKLLNRPLKVTFFRDIENPYYNQVFYKPFVGYNFYDGFMLGPTIYNQALFKKKWLFIASPVYGFKSNELTGGLGFAYEHLPQQTSVYRYRAGFSASRSHYDKDLAFNRFTPFVSIDFKRNSLRDVGGKALTARYVMVDKELPDDVVNPETYKYNILNFRYGYSKPEIVNDLRYFADFQYQKDFSRVSFDVRYRKLTNINRYLDFRLYFGAFLFNNTTTDFFSFASDRPSDYLFDLNYLGRSESSGFLSQEIIITEGGFKSIFEDPYANEWILSTNASISVWRWIEIYADAGFLKNKNENPRFKYDSGVRLNFIHNFLEVYFPLQSSLGFEPGFSDYASRIRFVLTLDFERIYNLIKRGFY